MGVVGWWDGMDLDLCSCAKLDYQAHSTSSSSMFAPKQAHLM